MKIAYVDFCNTLYKGYSLGEFLTFIAQSKGGAFKLKLFLSRVIARLTGNEVFKLGLFQQLADTELKAFATGFAQVNNHKLFEPVLSYIQQLESQGYSIVIVSASVSELLEQFQYPFKVDAILAVNAKESKNGTVYGEEKVSAMQQWESQLGTEIESRIAMSDHESDKPMFDYCDKVIVVNPLNSELLSWAEQYNWEIMYV